MTTVTDSTVYKSSETVNNYSMRNSVVKELVIPGKAGYQIAISKVGISIANEKKGVDSACDITVESGGKESRLGKWTGSNSAYEPQSAAVEFKAESGVEAKIRVYLKTANKSFKALVKDFNLTYIYKSIDGGESAEPVEEKPDEETGTDDAQDTEIEAPITGEYIIVRGVPESDVQAVIQELKKLVPAAEISTLQKS